MNIKPIPKKLLIHNISVVPFIGDDGWGDKYGIPYNIFNVRVEPVKVLRLNGAKFDSETNNVIFIDATFSNPFTMPNIKDKISFNGNESLVVKVNDYYDDSKLHHLEVEVK